MSQTLLSAVVLTYNEEQNLPACLESLQALECPVVVVDSGSTDRTCGIAAGFGATILEHPFVSHTEQWTWALANMPVDSQWILALDADQAITPELAEEIRRQLPTSQVDGLYISRRQVFRGRWIKHGGYYPKYLLKLFRRDKVFMDERDRVDHHFYVSGPCAKLRHDLVEINQKENSIYFWIEKHNRYAALLAREERDRESAATAPALSASVFGTPDQRTLRLKQFWTRLPLFVRPALYFIYRYIFLGGFLDGKEGFIFHFLQAYWYRLLIDINLDELRTPSRERPAAQAELKHAGN